MYVWYSGEERSTKFLTAVMLLYITQISAIIYPLE